MGTLSAAAPSMQSLTRAAACGSASLSTSSSSSSWICAVQGRCQSSSEFERSDGVGLRGSGLLRHVCQESRTALLVVLLSIAVMAGAAGR